MPGGSTPDTSNAGTVIAGRFVIQRVAGVGGMGRVYRARDNESGRVVALKVLHSIDEASRDRFEREARILSALSHPAIVGYVAHGEDDRGRPFLAMDWLEGEPLSARLRKGALEIEEAMKLGMRVAEALSCAHEAGVLHRDVKPANLILEPTPSGTEVRVVDFGVARHVRETLAVTHTGMIVGSCAYMSPEQALARRDIDPRSDLFSLGCVLYECVSGVRAFGARDATAALAKVLLDEPIPLHDVLPSVPRALADLVTWLLRKDPERRPPNARIVAGRLRDVLENRDIGDPDPSMTQSLGTRERRVVWVVLAGSALARPDKDEDRPSGATIRVAEDTATISDEEAGGTLRLHTIVKSYGGALAFLADATAIATFSGGVPTDEAARAARCALAMREALPSASIAIAMGLCEVGVRAPLGAVIDEAADALRRTASGAIRLHGVDRDWLLGFDVAEDQHGVTLVRAKEAALTPRTLLGRPTACVGREREIATLEGLFDDAATESQAKVALVTAPAGAGKSRIRHELCARLSKRDEPPMILIGRCDAMSAGAPFSAIGDAIRRHAGIVEGSTDAERKIEAMLEGERAGAVSRDGELRPPTPQEASPRIAPLRSTILDLPTHAALLGELAGVRFPDETSEMLRAARHDARLMGDLMRTALEEWLVRIPRPIAFVIEDLHWGDVPSVRLLDAALRNLASRPLFVLALARPEVSELFPSLWAERGLVSIALSPLSRRAAEKLVKGALGDGAPPAAVASLVARAQGNAFFLEELIRGAARGDAALPDSIFGILQTHLDAIDPDARRVLRAASVFGDSFTADGAFALLQGASSPASVRQHLDALAHDEIVTPAESGVYRFRHALVRDATYATLTDDDRKLGHRLAAELLEATGGAGALALAEHFVRGGAAERAIAHLRAAATKALEGNDIRTAVALGERALVLQPGREDQGVLHATCCEAYRWMGDYDHAAEHGLASIDALEEGTVAWFLAAGEFLAACAYRRDFEGAAPQLARARAAKPVSPAARNAQIVCIARGGTQLLEGGRFEEADAIASALRAEPAENLDDSARGWTNWLFAMRSLRDGDLATFARSTETCLAAFERLGDVRNMTSQRVNLGYVYSELGAFERAEPLLLRVHQDAERAALPMICAYALQNLGTVLRGMGRLEEARTEERRAVTIAESLNDRRIAGAARSYSALMTLELGDGQLAEKECRLAIAHLDKNPPLVGFARAVLSRALVAQARAAEALTESLAAMAIMDEGVEDGETFIRLAHIEALEANGDTDGARTAALEAERRLIARADRIQDDALRESFLERVPESLRTLAAAARLRAATAAP